jgi:hypothetical protein
MPYVLTTHALVQAGRRGISREIVMQVVQHPEQRFPQRPGRHIFQSRVMLGGKPWLVRVVVDVDRTPPEIVTAYRTSSIRRYWRGAP